MASFTLSLAQKHLMCVLGRAGDWLYIFLWRFMALELDETQIRDYEVNKSGENVNMDVEWWLPDGAPLFPRSVALSTPDLIFLSLLFRRSQVYVVKR